MDKIKHLVLTPGTLTLTQLREISRQPITLSLTPESIATINHSAQIVQQVLKKDHTVYGINTGFGLLATTKIANQDLQQLQRSIVLSHAAGTGKYMQDATVKLMMILKINSLSRGFSGVRLDVINALIRLVNTKVYPCVPEKGSVGASGDLAPLAHMCLPLLGEGLMHYQGRIISAQEGLYIANIAPLEFAAKEGLALLNGTQASTALALEGLFHSEDLFAASAVIGAMSVEATMGSRSPFDARIHAARGQQGQIDAAAMLRHLLGETSEIAVSHQDCDKVQDPYSLRCQPQVLGACLAQIRHAADVLHIEANGVTDNPLVFQDSGDIISGGNFHAEPVAMAADNLALALAELGAIAERRIALLINASQSSLPAFLVNNSGVNSGFMIAHVTAAALASENKTYAHPASVDSMPTSGNQEDHVSMANFAARRLNEMSQNTRTILAIEWLAAAQGLDFRSPLRSSKAIASAHAMLRNQVPYYDKDRYFAPDIEAATQLIASADLNDYLPEGSLPSGASHKITV